MSPSWESLSLPARTPAPIKGTKGQWDRLAAPALQQEGPAQHSRSRSRQIWLCRVQEMDLDAGEAVGTSLEEQCPEGALQDHLISHLYPRDWGGRRARCVSLVFLYFYPNC